MGGKPPVLPGGPLRAPRGPPRPRVSPLGPHQAGEDPAWTNPRLWEACVTDDTVTPSPRKRSESRQRAVSVAVRFTTDEAAALTAAADRAGLTTGAYLRHVALGSPGPRAARRPPVERVELARILGQLGHAGSNLNQVARAANSGGDLDPAHLVEVTVDVQTAARAVMKALGRGD